MPLLLVDQDEIKLKPSGFNWLGWDGVIAVSASSANASVSQKKCLLEKDITSAALKVIGKQYKTQTHTAPGSVIQATIKIAQNEQTVATSNNDALATTELKGTFEITVVPALNPTPIPPVPDAQVRKTGQWEIHSNQEAIFSLAN